MSGFNFPDDFDNDLFEQQWCEYRYCGDEGEEWDEDECDEDDDENYSD